ncbi:uncharacterized protein PRCAT00005352001 [Priceomyces carsonii]|uniref:uncharacterized protein n=1 Tax=Priceomyces carsonii TaxID=28549 RepID=UPI002ED7F0A2|nr:unnamed protein product [Priceomyces carsonii]
MSNSENSSDPQSAKGLQHLENFPESGVSSALDDPRGTSVRRLTSRASEESMRRSIASELNDMEAVSLRESLPEGFNADEKGFQKTPVTRFIRGNHMAATILHILTGAIWGVLARKGITALTTYEGSYLLGLVWANFGACLVMGLLIESFKFWEDILESDLFNTKGEIPLYVGITTGFCGTFSSFSSAILEIFNKATNTEPSGTFNYPTAGYGVMQFLAVALAQFGLSVVGFHMGKQLAEGLDSYIPPLKRNVFYILSNLSIVIGLAAYIVIIILIGVKGDGSWRSWTFSCLFAPFGALLRFYLSRMLNPAIKNFPLGTFTANFLGTILLTIFTLLSRGKAPGASLSKNIVTNMNACHVLNGLDDGFCGALTTVSTFVVELFGLKTIFTYRYGVFSIFLSFIFMILVLGTYNWSVGLTNAVCG